MMKWKVMKNTKWDSPDHEDVRRSLEILDNVLAEFDDGIGDPSSFSTFGNGNNHQQVEETQINGEAEVSTLERTCKTKTTDFNVLEYSANSLEAIKDGATSQTELSCLEDKTFSPPPVPKRNPTTRLSSRENLTLSGSFENIYANSFEIRRNVFDIQDGYRAANQSSKTKQKIKTERELSLSSKLSNQLTNTDVIPKKNSNLSDKDTLTAADDNDEVFISRTKMTLCRSASASMMTVESSQKSPNVASRRAFYEKSNVVQTEDAKRSVIHSDPSDNTFAVRNSPFLKKKFPIASSPKFHKRNVSDSTYCKTFEENNLPKIGIHRSQTFKDTSAIVLTNSPNVRPLKETKEERITRLHKKFAEVRHLLKTKQIKPLDCGPPRIIPTPPPQKVARRLDTKVNGLANHNEEPQCDHTQSDPNLQKDKDRVPKPPVTLVNTISDISCMLPTDTLNRPHLGLSYCMEDDLSPGVKELVTSTPKSDNSLEFSTFSQSFSSLGYSSGQSDMDLNLSLSEENKKIPITNLKSQTLPIGMKLGPPFSYTANINYDCDTDDHVKENNSDNQADHESDKNHFRSSSAPPIKHLLQRKNKFGMSKKELRDKTKNKDDNVSLKSNLSLDDGIILRKITALDGSTETKDFSMKKQTSSSLEEKTKRKSVWKSILRRK